MQRYMKQLIQFIFLLLLLCSISSILVGCRKTYDENTSAIFELKCSVISNDSLLPVEYTCDGLSETLPLEWSVYPTNTRYFALIMYTVASPTDIHWYWVLYNIPVSVNSLAKNTFGTGTLGNNSLNGMAAYAPPCSQGTGFKKYILTIYALTDSVTTTVPKPEVSMNVLVDAIKNITLAEASLTVKYSRIIDW